MVEQHNYTLFIESIFSSLSLMVERLVANQMVKVQFLQRAYLEANRNYLTI